MGTTAQRHNSKSLKHRWRRGRQSEAVKQRQGRRHSEATIAVSTKQSKASKNTRDKNKDKNKDENKNKNKNEDKNNKDKNFGW